MNIPSILSNIRFPTLYDLSAWRAKRYFTTSRRQTFYETLILNIETDVVGVTETLDNMYMAESNNGQNPDEPVAYVLRQIRDTYARTGKLSIALKPWITDGEYTVIAAGDNTDRLVDSLRQATKSAEVISKMIAAALTAFVYPVFLLVMIFNTISKLADKMLPSIESRIPRARWTGWGAALGYLGDFTKNYMSLSAILIVILLFAMYFSLSRWTGPYRVIAEKIPPYSIYKVIMASQFLLAFASLMKIGGRDQIQIIQEISSRSNPWMKERLDEAVRAFGATSNLGEAFQRAGHKFPDPILIGTFKLLSSNKKFKDVLDGIATRMTEMKVREVQAQARIILGAGVAIIGILILITMNGMNELNDLATRAANRPY